MRLPKEGPSRQSKLGRWRILRYHWEQSSLHHRQPCVRHAKTTLHAIKTLFCLLNFARHGKDNAVMLIVLYWPDGTIVLLISADIFCMRSARLLAPCSPQVVAANQKVEEANAKRQQESERSLQALQQKSADTYSKQVRQLSLCYCAYCSCYHCSVSAVQVCSMLHGVASQDCAHLLGQPTLQQLSVCIFLVR